MGRLRRRSRQSLAELGYRVTRQTGSYLRLTTLERGEHHATVPRHAALRAGTLAGILGDVAQHAGVPREALLERVFDR